MDDCLQKLIDRIDSGDDLQTLIPSQRISKLVQTRLEMQAPYISKWPQALSIQVMFSMTPLLIVLIARWNSGFYASVLSTSVPGTTTECPNKF